MSRLLTGLLAVAVLWFAYDQWVGESLAVESLPGVSAVALEGSIRAQTQESPQKSAGRQPAEGLGAGLPLDAESPQPVSEVDRLIAGIKKNEPAALQGAFGVLLLQTGEKRVHLARALRAAAESSPSAKDMVPLLGRNNAFLQCSEGRDLIAFAIERLAKESYEDALTAGTALLEACMRGPIAKEAADAHASVDAVFAAMATPLAAITLNPAHPARARSYEVKSGDSLDVIASRYRKQGYALEAGTLQLVNRISDPRRLQIGQMIKVPVDPVRTVINKASFLMAVYIGDTIVRLYWIGHGKANLTPEADFKIGVKDKHPDWKGVPYGHPDNPLGDYWVEFKDGLNRGIGAHGTEEPDSICDTRSEGCIRMRDADIMEFFLVVPRGSEVVIETSR